jgi:PKD repeat protein
MTSLTSVLTSASHLSVYSLLAALASRIRGACLVVLLGAFLLPGTAQAAADVAVDVKDYEGTWRIGTHTAIGNDSVSLPAGDHELRLLDDCGENDRRVAFHVDGSGFVSVTSEHAHRAVGGPRSLQLLLYGIAIDVLDYDKQWHVWAEDPPVPITLHLTGDNTVAVFPEEHYVRLYGDPSATDKREVHFTLDAGGDVVSLSPARALGGPKLLDLLIFAVDVDPGSGFTDAWKVMTEAQGGALLSTVGAATVHLFPEHHWFRSSTPVDFHFDVTYDQVRDCIRIEPRVVDFPTHTTVTLTSEWLCDECFHGEDFESTPTGDVPAGWIIVDGTVAVQGDVTNDSGMVSKALVMDRPGDMSVVGLPDASGDGFRLEVELWVNHNAQGFVHFRGPDLSNGYRVYVTGRVQYSQPAHGLVSVFKVTDGVKSFLAQAQTPSSASGEPTAGNWFRLTVEVEGDQIRVWEDKSDTDILVTDDTLPASADDRLLLGGVQYGPVNHGPFEVVFDNLSVGEAAYEPAADISLPYATEFEPDQRPRRNGVDLPSNVAAFSGGASYLTVTNDDGATSDALYIRPTIDHVMEVPGVPSDAFRLETELWLRGPVVGFVHFRGPDLANGYRVRVLPHSGGHPPNGLLTVLKVVDGHASGLANAQIPYCPLSWEPVAGRWYRLIIEVDGDQIHVWEDKSDTDILVTDDTFAASVDDRLLFGGRRLQAGGSPHKVVFDNLRIESPNQPPVVDAGGPYAGDEGSARALSGASAADPDDDPLDILWTVDSSLCSFSDPSVLNPDLTCLDDGTYSVTIRVDDGHADPVFSSAVVAVLNVAPRVEAGADQIVFEHNTAQLASSTFSDPGLLDTHTATVDWGDTAVEAAMVDQDTDTVSGSHVYDTPGTFTVTVTVEDNNGDGGHGSFTVTVVPGMFEACITASMQGHDLILEEGAVAECNVRGEGKVTLKKHSQVDGHVVARSRNAMIEADASVGGNVVSDDKVELKKRATVNGDITSGDDVNLARDSGVGGDVTAAGRVTLKSGATVGGTIAELANVLPVPEVTFVSVDVSAGGTKVTVAKNQPLALAPGTYGELNVKKGGSLTLIAGNYRFESIDVHEDSRLAFALGGASVVIDVEKKLDLKQGVEMTVSGGGASDILLRVAGSKVMLGKNGVFLGTVVAPDAHIDLREDSLLTGALHGNRVHLGKRATVVAAPAIDLIIDLFVP